MAIFWLQTVIKHDDGAFVRFSVDAPFDTIDDFAEALSDGEIIPVDRIWTTKDEAGRKYIFNRERMAIGADYVGMLQMPREQPERERSDV
jgi:hypothetical protein